MQLSEIEREQLYAIVEKYDHHPDVQRMREYIQHGSVTTYQHCKNVALVSFWLNRRLHLHADETSLAVGALLHDFYLYDWHTTGTFHGLRRLFEMHGFSHPADACVNAKRVFSITRKEQSIIASHMWPLTFRHVPTCREAVIVCLADKYCAVVESMFQRSPRRCRGGRQRGHRRRRVVSLFLPLSFYQWTKKNSAPHRARSSFLHLTAFIAFRFIGGSAVFH